MKWLTFKVASKPGFRFNIPDIIFIFIIFGISFLVYSYLGDYGKLYFIPIYVGFTFFLFCNVFRLTNKLEAIWHIPFTLILIYSLYFSIDMLWILILYISIPIKIALIVYRIRSDEYIGIFSEKKSHTRANPWNKTTITIILIYIALVVFVLVRLFL